MSGSRRSSGSRGRRPARRGRGKKGKRQQGQGQGQGRGAAADPRAFWGDPVPDGEESPTVRVSNDPAAVVRSLGPPPLGDRETIAEHYFEAVYAKAAALAGALGAAADLLEPEDVDAD